MTILVEWDNPEKTIIRYTFAAQWTVEEFFEAFPIADRMIREANTRIIGIIIDDSREVIPPRGAMTAFKQTVRIGKLPMVFVGANPASRSMMEILYKSYHGQRPMYYVETLAEARQILNEKHGPSNEAKSSSHDHE